MSLGSLSIEGWIFSLKYFFSDIVFFPFGPYAGDITGPDDDEDSILGPIQLQVPLIYYLRHQYQLHVSLVSKYWLYNSLLSILLQVQIIIESK